MQQPPARREAAAPGFQLYFGVSCEKGQNNPEFRSWISSDGFQCRGRHALSENHGRAGRRQAHNCASAADRYFRTRAYHLKHVHGVCSLTRTEEIGLCSPFLIQSSTLLAMLPCLRPGRWLARHELPPEITATQC